MIRLVMNLLWFLLGGVFLALAWAVLGLVLCITVVGIPFGIQCFKLARLSLFPYGKRVRLDFGAHPFANVVWALIAGWGLAVGYFIAGIANCITVVGIPNGIQFFKLMGLAFFPFGARLD
jgi:uncharacterized membrane protein YccF (DUF307 family)